MPQKRNPQHCNSRSCSLLRVSETWSSGRCSTLIGDYRGRTGPVHVGLWRVQAKSELLEGCEVARPRGFSNACVGVVDHECVHFRKQLRGVGMVVVVASRVPPDFSGSLDALVDGDGVGGLIRSARCQDVDGAWGAGEGCVIPCEMNHIFNLVELLPVEDTGCNHGDASRGYVVAEVGGLGLAGRLGGTFTVAARGGAGLAGLARRLAIVGIARCCLVLGLGRIAALGRVASLLRGIGCFRLRCGLGVGRLGV